MPFLLVKIAHRNTPDPTSMGLHMSRGTAEPGVDKHKFKWPVTYPV